MFPFQQIEQKFATLRNHLDVKLLVELDECRHRHAQLMSQFLHVITQIESYAISIGAARRNYQQEMEIERHYSGLQNEIATSKGSLNELHYVTKCLTIQAGELNTAQLKDNISGKDLKKVTELAKTQTEVLETLQEALNRAVKTVRTLEYNFINAAN